VFQSFALLPWLTVLENTAVGLEGSAEADPRELSGGRRHRVGFTRAFVMELSLLRMDEPFSALDILTSENVRHDIDELWAGGHFPARSIVIVPHSIEETLLLADRVVLELDDLLPIIDAGELLQLMAVEGSALRLTHNGLKLREAGEEDQQRLLRAALLRHVPLARQLQEALEASPRCEVEEEMVLELLDDAFTGPEAEAILATLVDWTRSSSLLRYQRERPRFLAADRRDAEAEAAGGSEGEAIETGGSC
jgi:hypothetical protein